MMKTMFLFLLLLVLPSMAAPPTTFSVTVSGDGERAMVLIPGLSCSGKVWDSTVAQLQNDYRLHVLTLAGYGGQPPVEGFTLAKVETELATYIQEQGLDHPILMGHSLGGFLVFAMGSQFPDLVGPLISVDGLPYLGEIMMHGATTEALRPQAEQMRTMMQGASKEMFEAQTRAALANWITDPAKLAEVATDSVRSDPATAGQGIFELMTRDLRPKLSVISSPVLLIGAAADFGPTEKESGPANYKAQISTIPNAQLVMVDNARHFVMLDQPAIFIQTVKSFLENSQK